MEKGRREGVTVTWVLVLVLACGQRKIQLQISQTDTWHMCATLQRIQSCSHAWPDPVPAPEPVTAAEAEAVTVVIWVDCFLATTETEVAPLAGTNNNNSNNNRYKRCSVNLFMSLFAFVLLFMLAYNLFCTALLPPNRGISAACSVLQHCYMSYGPKHTWFQAASG